MGSCFGSSGADDEPVDRVRLCIMKAISINERKN